MVSEKIVLSQINTDFLFQIPSYRQLNLVSTLNVWRNAKINASALYNKIILLQSKHKILEILVP